MIPRYGGYIGVGARDRAPLATRALIGIFVTALLLRWIYAIGLYAAFGSDALTGQDSHSYLGVARAFVVAARAGGLSGWAWLGHDLGLMPLFTWCLSLHAALAGGGAALSFVLMQGVIDSATCLIVAGMAARFAGRHALYAGYAAALTPTLIVMSGLVYTDTLFVFFATLGLYGALRWIEAPTWRWALVLGIGFGLAVFTRISGLPFLAALLPFMALVALIRRRFDLRSLTQLFVAALIVGAFVAPVLARNVMVYGSWSLTPQSGNHMANWIVPLVKEAMDGTPRETTNAATEVRMRERYGPMTGNPFVDSARYQAFAREELGKFGIGPIAQAWARGAAINLASPAVVLVPPVSNLPRTGFYDTPGRTFWEKLTTFFFGGGNSLYAWLLGAGLIGVAFFRLVQLAGAIALLWRGANLAGLMILGGWCVYILLLNGPIASPKYRLPLEPVMAVLTAAGAGTLMRRRSGKFQA